MVTAQFSSSILQGLVAHGLTLGKIAQITGLSASELRQILNKKARFSHKQLSSIERETGFGLGEMTLIGNPAASADSDFSALMKGWDNVAKLCARKPSAVK
jgi:transcriptional regulator with XRE-family HTH domain